MIQQNGLRTSLVLLLFPTRTYNVQAVSFTPAELVAEMRKYYPNMEVTYEPDVRQAIGKKILPLFVY